MLVCKYKVAGCFASAARWMRDATRYSWTTYSPCMQPTAAFLKVMIVWFIAG